MNNLCYIIGNIVGLHVKVGKNIAPAICEILQIFMKKTSALQRPPLPGNLIVDSKLIRSHIGKYHTLRVRYNIQTPTTRDVDGANTFPIRPPTDAIPIPILL